VAVRGDELRAALHTRSAGPSAAVGQELKGSLSSHAAPRLRRSRAGSAIGSLPAPRSTRRLRPTGSRTSGEIEKENRGPWVDANPLRLLQSAEAISSTTRTRPG
jgi:hypothetical protein